MELISPGGGGGWHQGGCTDSRRWSEVGRLLSLVKECTEARDLRRGISAHSQVTANGLVSDRYVATSLINMYAKCRSMSDAHKVFNMIAPSELEVAHWNALIKGYVENGEAQLAIEIMEKMEKGGTSPNSRSFVAVVSACGTLAAKDDRYKWLRVGQALHSRAVESRSCDAFVEGALIDMYMKCGNVAQARAVYDGMGPRRDLVSWNALVRGYVDNGECELALELFNGRKGDRNPRTYLAAVSSCAALAARDGHKERWLEIGNGIHSEAVSHHCCNVFVQNGLVDMYAKCGNMDRARSVFDSMSTRNVFSWNILLQGYVGNEQYEVALELFVGMEDPDERAHLAALSACGWLGLSSGKYVHSSVLRRDFSDVFVESALVDMYAKLGSVRMAQGVFDGMGSPNMVTWTALVMGYVDSGENRMSMEMILYMSANGMVPDSKSLGVALAACGNAMDMERGRLFHAHIHRSGLQDVELTSCLVEFYGKCGKMEVAKHVFDSSLCKSVLVWTALMNGYNVQGNVDDQVFKVFEGMVSEGLAPDEVMFIGVLSACNHGGLVEKGKKYFKCMHEVYGIKPSRDHFSCLIDLLGRANLLNDALVMLENMPFQPDVVTWIAVLSACHKWKNVEVARVAYESVMKLDEKNGAAYVLMGNIYRSLGMEDEFQCLKKNQ